MKLRFIVFLHSTNRPVHIENTRLYMLNKGEGANEFREKMIESIHNTNDSEEREHINCGAALVSDQVMNKI